MKKLTIIFVLLITGLAAQTAFGQKEKLTDQQRLILASRFLEEKPFDKDAKDIRAWAFTWAADTKDVTVIICGLSSPFLDKKAKFGGELVAQYAIAMTAFKLANPDKQKDENAAQLAGLESALKAYEAMLKENPKAKTDALEALLAKRNNGELAKHVADADCGKK